MSDAVEFELNVVTLEISRMLYNLLNGEFTKANHLGFYYRSNLHKIQIFLVAVGGITVHKENNRRLDNEAQSKRAELMLPL